MKNGLVVGIMSIVVVVVVLGSVLMPVLNDSYQMEGVTISNDGANDVKLAKLTSGFGLDLSVSYSGDDVTIVNGTDTITTTADPQIILATESAAIFFNNDGDAVCVWHDSDTTSRRVLSGDFTAVIADDKLTIDDGTASDLPVPATYMYVPSSTGVYGSFNTGGLNKLAEDPVIAVGDFASVAAYNQYTSTVDLNEHVTASSTEITSVLWDSTEIVPDEVESIDPFDPGMIVFDPGVISLDPLDPGVSIMSVTTPTYTDGDWGYELYSGKAAIVSYSGSYGFADITIPSTIGGYTVTEVGKRSSGGTTVFESTGGNYIHNLTIPEGVTTINAYAFKMVQIQGTVTLPSTLTKIDQEAFFQTEFTSINLPNSLTFIGSSAFMSCDEWVGDVIFTGNNTDIKDNAFKYCTGITSFTIGGVFNIGATVFQECTGLKTLVLLDNIASIGNYAFYNCSNLESLVSYLPDTTTMATYGIFSGANVKQVLNLGTLEITTTSYGMNADEVRDDIEASSYIAPYSISTYGRADNAYNDLLAVIPLLTVVALVAGAIGWTIYARRP